MRFPIIAKVAALGLVAIGLTWALDSVTHVVAERTGRQHEARRSVADSLATSQSLLGPVLQRSCTESWTVETGEGKDRKKSTEQHTFTLRAAPDKLTADATSKIEPRYRGIFKVNGFAMAMTLKAEWANLDALQAHPARGDSQVSCGAPVLWVAVTDARGLRDARVTLQDRELKLSPGTPSPSATEGFWTTLAESALKEPGPLRATAVLDLVGTESFAFAPVGASTRATLVSDWPHPSFNGRFLPAERNVGDTGFNASWQVGALASRASKDWAAGRKLCPPEGAQMAAANGPEGCVEVFGVAFIDPVSPYVLSDRATKYGLLFIALTFVTIALVEVMRRLRVHPVQYLLVGAALVIFFLLLVSLSEHVPFWAAYAASSVACTALLTYYGAHVLRSLRGGLALGGGIACLYGALYVLLLREQTALVLGALLLFAVLAAVMRVTRNVDWYAVIAQMRTGDASSLREERKV